MSMQAPRISYTPLLWHSIAECPCASVGHYHQHVRCRVATVATSKHVGFKLPSCPSAGPPFWAHSPALGHVPLLNSYTYLSCPHVHLFISTPPRERVVIREVGGQGASRHVVCLSSIDGGHADMRPKSLIHNGRSCPDLWPALVQPLGHEGTQARQPTLTHMSTAHSLHPSTMESPHVFQHLPTP